nr:hypothetical protein OG409_38220 [Streptomyces sp. NBC_00974]
MIQKVTEAVTAGEPLVADHDLVPVEDPDLVRPQRDTDVLADEPGRNRVLVQADRDPGGLIDLRSQREPDVEVLEGQGCQQRGLVLKVEAHRRRPVVDVPGILGRLDLLDLDVQVGERVDLGNRDQVRAAEPSPLVCRRTT